MPSTVIRFFRYDSSRRQLLVGFQTGRLYVYEGVPEETYDGMKHAFSKGEYFNAHIRDRFRFVRRDSI